MATYMFVVVAHLDGLRQPLAGHTTNGLRVACALSVPAVALVAYGWRRRSLNAYWTSIAWILLAGSFAALYVLVAAPAADARFLRGELDRLQTPAGARQISQVGFDNAFSGSGSFASTSYCVRGDPNSAVNPFRNAALDLEPWDPPSNSPGTNYVGRIGRVSISVTSWDVASKRGEDSTVGNLASACGPGELTDVDVQLDSF